MDALEYFKKLRDVSSRIVTAIESDDVDELERAMGVLAILSIASENIK